MPNSNYVKGVRKERKIVNANKKLGKIAFRSAGSHSPVDVVVIDVKKREIRFIQCKAGAYSKREIERVKREFFGFEGQYFVYFDAI